MFVNTFFLANKLNSLFFDCKKFKFEGKIEQKYIKSIKVMHSNLLSEPNLAKSH